MDASRQSGITLIEIAVLTVWLALGCAGAVWGSSRYGWVGGIAGFAGGLAASAGLARFLAFMDRMLYRGSPPVPICRSGKCRAGDYQIRAVAGGDYAYFCRCDGRYRKKRRRFMELMPDGSLRPYMIWRPFRGWFPERP